MINYIIVTIITLVLLFAVKFILELTGFNPVRKKPKSLFDQLNANPKFREMKDLFETLRELNKDGTDKDMIPEGTGEFGYDVTNPIPVNTVFGNTAYLSRLRTPEGVKVRYERQGSTHAPNLEKPVDIYYIFEGEKKIATLYISPYHKKNSSLAPKGFKLIEWS